jgi:hypothetical protein
MPAYGAAQRVKLSESWPKFKFFDFHRMLKLLLQGQKEVPGKENVRFVAIGVALFCDSWGGSFRCRQADGAF